MTHSVPWSMALTPFSRETRGKEGCALEMVDALEEATLAEERVEG